MTDTSGITISLQFAVLCDRHSIEMKIVFNCKGEDINKLVQEVGAVCSHIERKSHNNLSLYDFVDDMKSESYLTPWAVDKHITVFDECSVDKQSFDITSRTRLVREIKCVEIILSHNANVTKK